VRQRALKTPAAIFFMDRL